MRVAIFSWESLQSIAVGGVAVHVSELARSLASLGRQVHLFTRRGPDQSPYAFIDGVHHHRCSYQGSSDFIKDTDRMCAGFLHRLAQVERQDGRFDVLHAHDWLTAKTLSWARALPGGARFHVFTVHSTEFGRCGNAHCDGRSRDIRDREWEGAYHADRVIAVSRHLRDEVQNIYAVPDGKMHVVYNGVDVARFDIPVDPGQVKPRYGVAPMDPTVLFCVRMAWQKGPDILLEAIPPLLGFYPHAKFIFAGDGDMRWGLEERARRLGVAHATRFLGLRSGSELVELYKSCDLVCIPSRNEPFGIVLLEAWAAGKPVVATSTGGPAELISHGVNGLSIHDNPDSVGWGIGTLFMDFDNVRRMGRNGRKTLMQGFDWDTVGHRVAGVYCEAEASARPPVVSVPARPRVRRAVPVSQLLAPAMGTAY